MTSSAAPSASLADRVRAEVARPRGMAILLLLLSLLTFLPGQNTIPALDRDESRYATATRQMLDTGDFVQIRFMDTARNLQPAGIYWLQSASVSVFGDPEVREIWPHRVPSWINAIVSVFLTWAVASMLFGARAGRWAAVFMATAVILTVEARMAKIDATLCAVTLLAQVALARIYLTRDEPAQRWWWPALFWVALGMGLMLKGPIVLLVSGGTLLGLALLERRGRWMLRLQPLWGVPLMLAICLPWFIAIGVITDGEFFRKALGENAFGKVASAHEKHGGPPGYHLAAFTLMFFPASVLAWLSIPWVWANRATPAVRFCVAWIVPAWIAFEFFGTKLPHYTLPLLPAVAALAAAFMLEAPQKRFFGRPLLFAGAALLWVLFGLIVTVGPTVLQAVLKGAPQVLPAALAALALAGLVTALVLLIRGRAQQAAVAGVLTAVISYVNAYGFVVPAAHEVFLSPRILAAAEQARPACERPWLISMRYREPSLVFQSGNQIQWAQTPADAATALAGRRDCGVALIPPKFDAEFQARAAAAGVTLKPAGRIRGVNYNAGRGNPKKAGRNDIILYTAAP